MTEAPESPGSAVPLSLNDLLTTEAATWNSAGITPQLIEMLREQRERWNAEQAAGSRKRVTAKQITGNGTKAKPKSKLSLEGLKL